MIDAIATHPTTHTTALPAVNRWRRLNRAGTTGSSGSRASRSVIWRWSPNPLVATSASITTLTEATQANSCGGRPRASSTMTTSCSTDETRREAKDQPIW